MVGRRFASDGEPAAPEFQVNAATLGDQRRPDVAAASDGSFPVVWDSRPARGILAQRFSADGAPLGQELLVTESEPRFVENPSVAALPNEEFVVAWTETARSEKGQYLIRARRAAAGGDLGPSFLVGTDELTFGQYSSSIAADSSGTFVIAWFETTRQEMRGRRFRDNEPLGPAFTIQQLARGTTGPSLCASESGEFVVAWSGYERSDPFNRRKPSSRIANARSCLPADINLDYRISIDELVAAVRNAMQGCD